MQKALKCVDCGDEFVRTIVIDGIRKNLSYKRVRCLKCTPHVQQGLLLTASDSGCQDGYKMCRLCVVAKPLSEFSPNRKDGYLNSYCKACAAKKAHTVRQRWKLKCVEYKGGSCVKCGYNKCVAALEFHHRDRSQKDFQISRSSYRLELTGELKAELDKCDLLCSNCHKEVEYQLAV